MTGGRLPQLDPVALRIGDPSEPTVGVLVALVVDGHALSGQLPEHAIEVVNPVVDHAGRREVARLGRKERPHRAPHALGPCLLTPLEHRPALLLYRNSEVLAIPLAERRLVTRLEEDAAEPGHPSHFQTSWPRRTISK